MVRYPETVDMGSFYDHDDNVKPSRKLPKPYCGTTACLAGHIVIASGVETTVDTNYPQAARGALGLKDDSSFFSHILFSAYNTATGADYPRDRRAQARAVVTRVRHWIRTGE